MTGIIGQDPRGRSGIVNQFTDVGLNTSLDSEWHSSMNAVQINSGSLSAHDSYPHYVQLNANVVQKDSGEKRVNNSYKASQHRQWDGEHIFKVAPAASGDISWVTGMTINNDGDIYSTGWTSFSANLTGVTSALDVKIARYMRIGNLVWWHVYITGTRGGGTTTCTITGLPITASDTTSGYYPVVIGYAIRDADEVTPYVTGVINNDTTTVRLWYNSDESGWVDGNQQLIASGWYPAKSW